MAGQQTPRLQTVSPVGRYITGDHTKVRTIDQDGRPLPPEKQNMYGFGLAIRKTDPALPQFLNDIWNFTCQCYAQNGQIMQRIQRGFAVGTKQGGISWKIKDGDQPNADGKMMENAAGCYVLFFQTAIPIKCCDNQNREIDPAMIKRGFWIDVAMSVTPNDQPGDRAGIYLNPSIMRLLGFDKEIVGGLTPEQAFGGRAAPQLPAGVSTTPIAPAGGIPTLPGMSQQPGFTPQPSPGFVPPMQQPYGGQPSIPGVPPQNPPVAGGWPNAPQHGTPANVPGFVPNAAVPPGYPAQSGYAPTPVPSTVYPSSGPGNAPMPVYPGQPTGVPGVVPQPYGNGSPATGYPINPATGLPVQPHPGFLQPGQPPR